MKSAHQHLAARLHGNAIDRPIGRCVEAGIQRAIGAEPNYVLVRHAADHQGRASHQQLAVGLHGHAVHRAARRGHCIECGIQSAIGAEPGHPVAHHAIDLGEIATQQDLAVGLHHDRTHRVIGSRPKPWIGHPIGLRQRRARQPQPRQHGPAKPHGQPQRAIHGCSPLQRVSMVKTTANACPASARSY